MQEKLENILFTAIIIPKGRIKASFTFSAFGYLNKICFGGILLASV